MLYIGNHTSSSRGYLAMGKQMLANGGNTFAFFTRNPRGGKAKDIDPQDVQAFGQLAEENHFGKLVAHAPYLCYELLRCQRKPQGFCQRNHGR